MTRASYEVSRLLGRQMKPFTDGDFIKECIMVVIDSLCPEKRSVFESVSLVLEMKGFPTSESCCYFVMMVSEEKLICNSSSLE